MRIVTVFRLVGLASAIAALFTDFGAYHMAQLLAAPFLIQVFCVVILGIGFWLAPYGALIFVGFFFHIPAHVGVEWVRRNI